MSVPTADSRWADVEVLPDERRQSAMAFLHRAVQWFQKQGFCVPAILAGNGSCHLSHAFAGLCRQLQLRHLRTRPGRPRTSGEAER